MWLGDTDWMKHIWDHRFLLYNVSSIWFSDSGYYDLTKCGARRRGYVGPTWAPEGMDKGRALAPCCKCCLESQQMKYLCIILRKCWQLLGASSPDPHRSSAPGPCWGTSVIQTPSLPIPGKKSCGHQCLYRDIGVYLSKIWYWPEVGDALRLGR